MKYWKILLTFITVIVLIVGAVYFASHKNEPQSVHESEVISEKNEANPYAIMNNILKGDKKFNININQEQMELNGKKIERYVYSNQNNEKYASGQPIIVNVGDRLEFDVKNNTNVPTNIHWHGMAVPNDQDGPEILIEPGKFHTYTFTAEEAGTYWYHSHERPVRKQVDAGMYGAIIVRAPEDEYYSKDQIFMIDDWVINKDTGHMEVIGDVDTVNGKTGEDISPIEIQTGEIQKLRFINASTAKVHQLDFPVPLRVTHTDGAPLVSPYRTKKLTISPGERYDVELSATDVNKSGMVIKNERDHGLVLPINFVKRASEQLESPFLQPNETPIISDIYEKEPDVLMELNAGMGRGGMVWTINGEIFPDVEQFSLTLNKSYKMRFVNNDHHKTGHPMHVHGTHFRVIARNGEKIADEIWKDTIDIPRGGYVDVMLTFDKPGTWMVHCHVLDHEDGGMMTSVIVK